MPYRSRQPRSPLQDKYRRALSGAVVAKARYLAVADEPSCNGYAVKRAAARWQRLERYKNAVADDIAATDLFPAEVTRSRSPPLG